MTAKLNSFEPEFINQQILQRFELRKSQLKNLVSIPSIAWDAYDAKHLWKSADEVAKLFASLDFFDEVRVAAASKFEKAAPAVLAKRAAKNGKPQVLLYAHHDVQPVGDESLWLSSPFDAEERAGRLYGRGAADDKAGILVHLESLATLIENETDPDLGITLFIEGEEEAGSPSFDDFLDEHRELLASDVIIVADSGNWTTEIPALTTSLRGLVSQTIKLSTLDHALHSGMYGGAVPDSVTAMVRLLASLHHQDGSVAIEGLVENEAADIDYSDQQLAEDSGLLPGVGQLGTGSILSRLWTKPAVTILAIDAPSVAEASNTLQPSTRAKVSLRIAPGEQPQRALNLLREHLLKHVPFGAQLEFEDFEAGDPYLDHPGWAKELAAHSLELSFGLAPIDMGVGGSIPFIAKFKEVYPQAQILVTGVEDPDSRAHSPNESLHLESFRKAMLAQSLFLLQANQLRLGE
jgi:acetylornithine deacetylase/succinyl-diaminopimelate desuccinylase-like protein